jgi:hypothetical protein
MRRSARQKRVAKLGLTMAGLRSSAEIASHSHSALDRPLRYDGELWVAVASDEARLLGAFQRAEASADDNASLASPLMAPRVGSLLRRGSGGPDVLVGRHTVHIALALAHPASLAACDEKRIVNRYVRPLLRALTATGSPAAFFGRDWISVSKQPAAWVGFGHDRGTRRTLFEAFVAVASPFASMARGSFRGRAPGTLESIARHTVDPFRLAKAVVDAYSEGHEVAHTGPLEVTLAIDPAIAKVAGVTLEPPWAATSDEAIGRIGAGPDAHGVFRVGGDLLVSRDALAHLEARVALAAEDDIGAIVDESLTAPGVALDGVQSLVSLRDVILRARRAGP